MGFITPTSSLRFLNRVARQAVTTVLPTPVSVPVMKYPFMLLRFSSTYKSDIINNGFPVRRQVINDFVKSWKWDQKN
jgi:hypothetical protein